MNLSKRTKLSLSQFLSLFGGDDLYVMFEKYNINLSGNSPIHLSQSLMRANGVSIRGLVDEIAATKGDLRSKVSPKYRFDERWEELVKCLFLDGYRIPDREIISIEPVIEGNQPIEDDLQKELMASRIPESDNIAKHIDMSAKAFLKSSPDFNGCLSHARVALETLVRNIAIHKGMTQVIEAGAWGRSLSHLSTAGLISKKDEKAIASIYTFVSDGAHIPLGFTEEEYVRFGRNLVTSMCYYIVKLYRGL